MHTISLNKGVIEGKILEKFIILIRNLGCYMSFKYYELIAFEAIKNTNKR
jgi:hypothetical protein